jgi:hypothetical protein
MYCKTVVESVQKITLLIFQSISDCTKLLSRTAITLAKSSRLGIVGRRVTTFSHYKIAVNTTLVVSDSQVCGGRISHIAGVTEHMELDSLGDNLSHEITSRNSILRQLG